MPILKSIPIVQWFSIVMISCHSIMGSHRYNQNQQVRVRERRKKNKKVREGWREREGAGRERLRDRKRVFELLSLFSALSFSPPPSLIGFLEPKGGTLLGHLWFSLICPKPNYLEWYHLLLSYIFKDFNHHMLSNGILCPFCHCFSKFLSSYFKHLSSVEPLHYYCCICHGIKACLHRMPNLQLEMLIKQVGLAQSSLKLGLGCFAWFPLSLAYVGPNTT